MNTIRRHLTAIGVVWLVFQASVLAMSPYASCCVPAPQNAVDDDDCCKGMAPGQMCPLHKHRHAPSDTREGQSQGRCAVSNGCDTTAGALLAFSSGPGIPEPPVSLAVNYVSSSVSAVSSREVHRARSLDPPPPRA